MIIISRGRNDYGLRKRQSYRMNVLTHTNPGFANSIIKFGKAACPAFCDDTTIGKEYAISKVRS